MTATREIEKGDLSAFANVYGTTDYEFGDKIDFTFIKEGRRIGVEHCRIYVTDVNLVTGKQLLPQERIHWDIIDRARNILKQKSKLHLWAVVMFDMGSSNYRKVDINPTAELLVNTILEDLYVCEFIPPKVARKIYVRELKYKGLPHPQGIFSISYSIEDPKTEV